MKKLLLFFIASSFSIGAFSQNCETTPPSSVKVKTADGNHLGTADQLWICENLTFEIIGKSTVAYIEKNCDVTITGDDQNTIYMKAPGTITINGNGLGTYILDSGVVVSGTGMGSASITTCMSFPGYVKYNYDNVPATAGCIDTSKVGIQDLSGIGSVEVYPNPASEVLNIRITSAALNSTYKVYSISGKVVLNGILKNYDNQLDISILDKGLYFIELENASGRLSKRISVE